MTRATKEELRRIVGETTKSVTGWPDPEQAAERLKKDRLDFDSGEFYEACQGVARELGDKKRPDAGWLASWGLVRFWVVMGVILAISIAVSRG